MKKHSLLFTFTFVTWLLLALALSYVLVLAQPASLDSPQASAPAVNAWDSGWVNIAQDQTITLAHHLGLPPEQLWAELWFRDTNGNAGINRVGYGGLEKDGAWYGAYWHHFTSETVQVTRLPDDIRADQVHIRVWVIDPPDYDSGWIDKPLGPTHLNHSLGISNTDLMAAIWFSGTAKGIHHYGYGTLTVGNEESGAYWMRLTDNSIETFRRPYDVDVEQIRVLVTKPDPPDYDSLVALGDWQDVSQESVFTFTHNLNWNPSFLMVRADCNHAAPGGQGINHSYAGGAVYNDTLYQGYHTQNLTANSLHFVRRANDPSCDSVRVRIWKRAPIFNGYLPLIMRGT